MESTKIDGRRKYLSVDEVAAHLGVGRTFIYNEVASGSLKAKRFGKKNIKIHLNELARYESDSDWEPGQYRESPMKGRKKS